MGDPKVTFDNAYSSFDSEDVAAFLDWKDFENDGLRMYTSPRIVWRVTVSGYTPERISVSRNKDVVEKDVERPDEDMIAALYKHYVQASKCNYLYLDANGIPIFFGDKSTLVCVEEHLYDTLPKISLDQVRDLIRDLDKSIKTTYFISPRDMVFYCRKSGVGKLFYPFLREWIERSYQGLLDPGDAAQMMSEEGLRVLLSYFIAKTTGHYIPISNCIFPQAYQFIVSLDGYLDSPFGATGLPDGLIKDIKKMMPSPSGSITLKAEFKERTASTHPGENKIITPSNRVISDPALLEIVKTRMTNDITPFYDTGIITSTDLKDPITDFVSMSWVSFMACMEQVKTGASIFFAPHEVVMDDVGHIIFSGDEFPLIHYHGPEFALSYKKNSVDVLYRGDKINVEALANLREFFKRVFDVKVLSVTSVSESKKS